MTGEGKRRRLTLRGRLTLLYGGLFLVAGVFLLGLTYVLFLSQIGPVGDRVLIRSSTEGSASGSTTVPSSDPTPDQIPAPSAEQPRIRTLDGQMLNGTDAQRWLEDQERSLRRAAARSLLVEGGIALVVVGGVAMGFGWLLSGRVLAPLQRVTATAHRISAAPAADMGLHERIALDGPDDEVRELADAFDSMVGRLDRSFAGQRRFVANASHELRTPLTVGRAMIETAVRRPGASADLKKLGEDLLAWNVRHEALIAGLLDLAGAENGPTGQQVLDLADVADHVLETVRPEAELSGIDLEVDLGQAPTSGDALLLERLVTNLVENGIRHNVPGGWVRVATSTHGDHAIVVVSNSGPVVAAFEVASLFEPFRRLGSDRVSNNGGTGLGLSIVETIARVHDGTVEAKPRSDGGLEVTVRLAAGTLE